MVCHRMAAIQAGIPCPHDNRLKMAIFRIFQHLGKLAGRPRFVPIRILLSDSLKGSVMQIGDALGVHGDSGLQFMDGKTTTTS